MRRIVCSICLLLCCAVVLAACNTNKNSANYWFSAHQKETVTNEGVQYTFTMKRKAAFNLYMRANGLEQYDVQFKQNNTIKNQCADIPHPYNLCYHLNAKRGDTLTLFISDPEGFVIIDMMKIDNFEIKQYSSAFA